MLANHSSLRPAQDQCQWGGSRVGMLKPAMAGWNASANAGSIEACSLLLAQLHSDALHSDPIPSHPTLPQLSHPTPSHASHHTQPHLTPSHSPPHHHPLPPHHPPPSTLGSFPPRGAPRVPDTPPSIVLLKRRINGLRRAAGVEGVDVDCCAEA